MKAVFYTALLWSEFAIADRERAIDAVIIDAETLVPELAMH